uniref:Methionine--tRNA ligase, cytoplasmic n=1 Tax=Aceria tosichella TaxID=561515 RepID=A0A6G1SLZ3_9ACAR
MPATTAPKPGKRNVLVTSALPYVNNIPHLGNLVGSVLSADVFARYCRLRDYETLYVSGTDEYGTASETKALELKKTPKEVCDEYHVLHAEIYQWFNIDFDKFGRTTNEHQTKLAQDLFTKLEKNNYLFEDVVEQLYCCSCSRFLADRFVEGTCPNCQYEDARGDQCDKCGKLINAIELKNPACKLCKSSPIVKESKHFFFDLSKVEQKLKDWYQQTISRSAPPPRPLQSSSSTTDGTTTTSGTNSNLETTSGESHTDNTTAAACTEQKRHILSPNDTHWTHTARSITESWFKEGLKPRCITRDLKWGTKIPYPGYEDKVFYVWFDAPIGYLSITASLTSEWEKWWKNEQDVELYQFLAKDNVLFHSIMFPATLFATGEPWVKVKALSVTDYLNYEGIKFSKSRGLGVFGNDARDTGIPADVWRFYLMYIRPEGQDSSFCWDDFKEKVNGELLNNLGNFINRAVSFVDKNFAGQLSHYEPNEEDLKYLDEVGQNLIAYEDRLERVMLREGLKPILAISKAGNQLIQANKPWVLIKGDEADKKRAETVMHLALNTVALIGLLISPYMPEIGKQIRKQLALECDQLVEMSSPMPLLLPVGHKIGTPALLFKRLEVDQIKELKKRFGA